MGAQSVCTVSHVRTSVAPHNIKTSHSPSRRSIPTTAHWRRSSVAAWQHIKISHSPSRRSIPQAPTQDAHQWHDSTSKPAIPHLDARFHKCPLETHISGGMTAHQNQPFPSRRSIPPASRDAHQWQNAQTSHSPSRPIPQAPTRDERQWQHTASNPVIPHLDARFHVEASDRSQIQGARVKLTHPA